ncbi:hypothetical protein VTJ49DRAFT_7665 [Mycothermus thermophilus]|uniref:Uncharacterized protein n=1 Tax=Humicola insolens TaxID=85995 RepID=A0ABR3VHQ8_HUMIN
MPLLTSNDAEEELTPYDEDEDLEELERAERERDELLTQHWLACLAAANQKVTFPLVIDDPIEPDILAVLGPAAQGQKVDRVSRFGYDVLGTATIAMVTRCELGKVEDHYRLKGQEMETWMVVVDGVERIAYVPPSEAARASTSRPLRLPPYHCFPRL